MPSVNKQFLVGHLGQEPKVFQTKNGSAILSFSIATTSRFKSGDEWKEETTWHNVKWFSKKAAEVGAVLSKGSLVSVEGELRTETYDKDGAKKLFVYTKANVVIPCEWPRGERGDGAGERGTDQYNTSDDFLF